MAYYLETKQWKSLTVGEREEAMREFHFLQENMWRLPPGYLMHKVSAAMKCSGYSVYAALNFRQFHRGILHQAYVIAVDYLKQGVPA